MFKSILGAAVLYATAILAACAEDAIQSEQAAFRVVTVAEGLDFPWSLAFLPGGDMLVTERGGHLRLIRGGQLQTAPVGGLEDRSFFVEGQSGLHDIVLHPDFTTNHRLYIAYMTGTTEANHLEVASGTWTGDAVADLKVIFRTAADKQDSNHPGGRMVFMADGTLLLSVGDGFNYKDKAQDRSSHLGSILRLTDEGKPAPDTPQFAGKDFLPEIYTTGHRNPQGLTLRPGTDEIWEHEHGPRGGDEINIITPGANYGWPLATYGIDYDGSIISKHRRLDGTQQPIWYWVPSIAPSGMAFYDGDAFPEWKGDLFIGALAHQKLVRLEIDGTRIISEEDLLDDRGERIRDVRSGPDGRLYVLTDAPDGKVLKLEPAN